VRCARRHRRTPPRGAECRAVQKKRGGGHKRARGSTHRSALTHAAADENAQYIRPPYHTLTAVMPTHACLIRSYQVSASRRRTPAAPPLITRRRGELRPMQPAEDGAAVMPARCRRRLPHAEHRSLAARLSPRRRCAAVERAHVYAAPRYSVSYFRRTDTVKIPVSAAKCETHSR